MFYSSAAGRSELQKEGNRAAAKPEGESERNGTGEEVANNRACHFYTRNVVTVCSERGCVLRQICSDLEHQSMLDCSSFPAVHTS